MTPALDARVGTPTIPGARTRRPLAGPLLIAISVLHLACTPVFYGPGLAKIIDDGILNAVESGSSRLDARAATFWYVIAGLGVGLLGFLVWWVERQVGTLPGALGWLLVAFTVINVALMPLSGFGSSLRRPLS